MEAERWKPPFHDGGEKAKQSRLKSRGFFVFYGHSQMNGLYKLNIYESRSAFDVHTGFCFWGFSKAVIEFM